MNLENLPFSQSCENNKQPILDRLTELLAASRHVLEIAGGTGQHAEFFATELPHLRWQSSDIPTNVTTLNRRLDAASLGNLPTAMVLDVNQKEWLLGTWKTDYDAQQGVQNQQALSLLERASHHAKAALIAEKAGEFDAVFSANSLHIMSAGSVTNFFLGAGKLLKLDDKLIVYGPFNYGGEFTSSSNAKFDQWLKQRNPQSGIRDFESVTSIADVAGFDLQSDNEMPANNRLLVWTKRASD